MIRFIYVLVLLTTISCSTTKKAQQKLSKIKKDFPELFDADTIYNIKTDTIVLTSLERRVDTLVLKQDTIRIENEDLSLQIIEIDNNYVGVAAICKPDTLTFIRSDTIATIKEKVSLNTVYERYIPIWMYILIGVLILMIIKHYWRHFELIY